MIQIVYGTEPYGIDVKRKKLINSISVPSMNLSSHSGNFTEEIMNECNSFPFMEKRRAVILEVESLEVLNDKIFKSYLKSPAEFTDLFIIAKKVDKRTKAFKEFESKGLLVPCMKLTNINEFKAIVFSELSSRGAKISEKAFELFVKKMNYFDKDDMTLLDVVGHLNACIDMSSTITDDIVDACCPSYENAQIFTLTSLIKENQADELYRQIRMISEKDSIGILSLLLKDFRVAYKLKFFSEKEVTTKRTAFSTYDSATLSRCMEVLTSIISGIKTGVYTSENALSVACSRLLSINKECA